MLDLDSRPRLARKARLRWDPRDRRHLLLYPERGLALDEIAAHIVRCCDGTATIAAIVADLAALADAPAATVEADVLAFLRALAARRLVEAA